MPSDYDLFRAVKNFLHGQFSEFNALENSLDNFLVSSLLRSGSVAYLSLFPSVEKKLSTLVENNKCSGLISVDLYEGHSESLLPIIVVLEISIPQFEKQLNWIFSLNI